MSGDRWDDLRATLAAWAEEDPEGQSWRSGVVNADVADLLAERDTLAASEAIERRQRIAYQQTVDRLMNGDADEVAVALLRSEEKRDRLAVLLDDVVGRLQAVHDFKHGNGCTVTGGNESPCDVLAVLASCRAALGGES